MWVHCDYSLFSNIVWCRDSGKWEIGRKEKGRLANAVSLHICNPIGNASELFNFRWFVLLNVEANLWKFASLFVIRVLAGQVHANFLNNLWLISTFFNDLKCHIFLKFYHIYTYVIYVTYAVYFLAAKSFFF